MGPLHLSSPWTHTAKAPLFLRMAILTGPVQFRIPARQVKTFVFSARFKIARQFAQMRLDHRSAIIANHELRSAVFMIRMANDIGVQTLNAVRKTLAL